MSGNWLNRAPSYTLNFGAQYTAALGNGGKIVFRGESYFSGRVHYNEFDNPKSVQGAYSLQNVFVTYTAPEDRFSIRGYVKNIGNKDILRSYFYSSALLQAAGNYAAPRTYGIEATVRF